MNTRHKPLLIALIVALSGACASNPATPADDDSADDAPEDDDSDMGGATASDGGSQAPRSDAQSSSGGGGDSGSGGGAAGTVDCSGDMPADPKDRITNFEDMTVGVDMTGGWVGGFYIFNDKMNDPSQTATVEAVDRCSDGSSKYAYCTKGSGFMIWGAGIGTDLGAVDPATMAKATVDLSAYSGVSFWVKRNGTGTMPGTAKVIIPDENTSDEGKKCTNEASAPATMKCDPFTANIPLSNTWTKHTVQFSKLKQGAWGKPVPAFAAGKVYGIQLQFPMSMSFDVCIDHVMLVR